MPLTTPPTTPRDAPATTVLTELTVPDRLAAFPVREITVDGDPWVVAVADTPARRSQGLMLVTDLGSLDGMLFVFDGESTSSFWMKDTLIPLDIAFFDAAGDLVDRFAMVPCTADPCPSYPAAGPYLYALEAPEGALELIGPGSRLEPGG